MLLPESKTVFLSMTVLPGPALQPKLASVLNRFRTHKVGLIADVEKIYLPIKLAPKDQDVHHYLWRDLKTEEAPKLYRMQRLTFAVSSSPFLAIATVTSDISKYAETFPDATREILHNMYVDDCLTGADTDNSALKLQQEMSEFMMAAAFNLTKWASNSKLVMDGIDPDKRATSLLVECDSCEPRQDKTRQDLFYSAQFYRTFRLKLHRQLNTVQLRNKREKKNVTIN